MKSQPQSTGPEDQAGSDDEDLEDYYGRYVYLHNARQQPLLRKFEEEAESAQNQEQQPDKRPKAGNQPPYKSPTDSLPVKNCTTCMQKKKHCEGGDHESACDRCNSLSRECIRKGHRKPRCTACNERSTNCYGDAGQECDLCKEKGTKCFLKGEGPDPGDYAHDSMNGPDPKEGHLYGARQGAKDRLGEKWWKGG